MNMRPRASSHPPRRGMALPMVIVVLLVLTASFAGGVALASGERALDDAGKSGVLAQAWAEAGLQRIVSDRSILGLSGEPTAAGDSTRVTFSGGYYDVTTTRLRAAVGTTVPGLYFVRSHAVVTRTGVASGPSAEYTVTMLGVWAAGTMTVQSAMTGVNGVIKSGNAGTISGVDECPAASGGGATTLPALAVPVANSAGGLGYSNPAGNPGPTAPLLGAGSPPISNIGATPTQAAAAVPIDWVDIYGDDSGCNGSIAWTYCVDYQGNGYPTSSAATNFPNDGWFASHPNDFPVIFVKNGAPNAGHEFVLPNSGRGMLIVQDDIGLNGNTAGWNGILLIGGRLRSSGTNVVQGATVTGLNVQKGVTPQANDVNDLAGTKQYLYDSCAVRNAASALGKLRVYKNTWSNSFKTY